jgi:hypothetical protein
MRNVDNRFHAKVDGLVLLVREWQRGAISWVELETRADLTPKGYGILVPITETTGEDEVRRLATAAVGAGY